MLGPLPPYVQIEDFLPASELAALLDWTLANEQRFNPAKVTRTRGEGRSSVIEPGVRIASTLRDLGPVESVLRERLLAALPDLMASTRIQGAEPRSLELELAAHGDGAHYGAHLDIPVGPGRQSMGATEGEDRVLSAVFYFHNQPKGFSGGALRIHRFGTGSTPGEASLDDVVDIDPTQNSLVVFPSWARHEVRTVSCPSGRFRDYRFALNCWYCRRLSEVG